MYNQHRNGEGGGVSIYMSDVYDSILIPELSFTESYIEACISLKEYVLFSVCRPPRGNKIDFLDKKKNIFLSKIDDIMYIWRLE